MLSVRRAICEAGGGGRSYQISIHALREEGDTDGFSATINFAIFLSTPSVRRATFCSGNHHRLHPHFYPRPPRGGRPSEWPTAAAASLFLSTPSVRRATFEEVKNFARFIFLSTPSARRATPTCPAARAGARDFYPRPPRGGRQVSDRCCYYLKEFLSTPSARRATGDALI